eukprot:tig00020562_g11151.t1
MGRKRKWNNAGKKGAVGPDGWAVDSRKVLQEYQSAFFDDYYKGQGIVSEEEWPQFMEALRRPLPITFRINGSGKYAAVLRSKLERRCSRLPDDLVVEGQKVEHPVQMPWYPDGLGWHFGAEKRVLRKNPLLKAFHEFLMVETDLGNISRQEAVSMIPPLLLEARPGDCVLDMCAAPGSKTAQLMEAITCDSADPTGLVVGNDADYRRAYMLVHQCQRLSSPTCQRLSSPTVLVTNHEGQNFPYVRRLPVGSPADAPGERLLFDRILCDVPCTGDGTMRKAPDLWRRWSASMAIGMHRLQLRIAARGVQLLKVGGHMVYSTCSFNPVENEAVVAALIAACKGAIEIVDVSAKLPGLKRRPGLTSWRVFNPREKEWYQSPAQISGAASSWVLPSMFPPESAVELNLQRCVRIVPQDQDTGGFFIVLLRKTREVDNEFLQNACYPPKAPGGPRRTPAPGEAGAGGEGADSAAEGEAGGRPRSRRPRGGREGGEGGEKRGTPNSPVEPFVPVDPSGDFAQTLSRMYGITPEFPWDRLVTRGAQSGRIYLINRAVREIIQADPEQRSLKVVTSGVQLFERKTAQQGTDREFRMLQEGIQLVAPYMKEGLRLLDMPTADLVHIIRDKEVPIDSLPTPAFRAKFSALEEGSVVVRARPYPDAALKEFLVDEPLYLVMWRGRAYASLFLDPLRLKGMRMMLVDAGLLEAPPEPAVGAGAVAEGGSASGAAAKGEEGEEDDDEEGGGEGEGRATARRHDIRSRAQLQLHAQLQTIRGRWTS